MEISKNHQAAEKEEPRISEKTAINTKIAAEAAERDHLRCRRSRRSPRSFLSRITHDVAVVGGRPFIRGMRVTVGTILGLLASGQATDEVLAAYPYLEKEDIQAALAYAAWRAEEIEVPLRAS